MPSVREQILDYVVARLETVTTTTPSLKERVHRSRQNPVRRSEGVQVIVEPVAEDSVPIPASRMERELTIRISIRAHGDVPDSVVDPYALAIYAKLMANDTVRRLGGLAALPIRELSRTFPMEDADGDPIDYQILFVVTYRTTLESEETVG